MSKLNINHGHWQRATEILKEDARLTAEIAAVQRMEEERVEPAEDPEVPRRVRLVFKAPRETELGDVEDRRLTLANEFRALPSQNGAFAKSPHPSLYPRLSLACHAPPARPSPRPPLAL